jgi:hypothetical protein
VLSRPLRGRGAAAAQVSFYSWGADAAGVAAELGTLAKIVAAADVLLGIIVMVNWSEVSRLVKEKQA